MAPGRLSFLTSALGGRVQEEIEALQRASEAGAAPVPVQPPMPAASAHDSEATAPPAAAPPPLHPVTDGRYSADLLRVLVIQRERNSFGFNLSRVEGRHLVRVVEPGGSAEKAGATPGDELIAVGGGRRAAPRRPSPFPSRR
jgi:S1-C subfamily serine protease